MPYDTEADFAANYRIPLHDPVTGARYNYFKSAEFPGETISIYMHYHRSVFKAAREVLADRVIADRGITAQDSIIIFGGAYGWLGEFIEQKTGAPCVSVDTSAYINSSAGGDSDLDLKAAIEAAGYSIATGTGKIIYDRCRDPGPRVRISGGVINENLANNGSRQRVIAKLPKNPTLIITEEVWQVLTDSDRLTYRDRLLNFGVPVLHIIDNQLIVGP